MRRPVLALAVVLTVSACGSPGPVEGSTTQPGATPPDTAELMAVALEELVSGDNTFGDGPPPFSEYLIESNTVPPEFGTESSGDDARPLTDDERAAIEAAISEWGPVRWIEDPDDWRTEDLQPEIEGMVILGVDEPAFDEEGALVHVSLWCGGLCGTWFTYRLAPVDGSWQVTGIEGPVTIS